MDNHSLSVIVPVYNAETTLKYCVESILNQTYQEFELILVNDGSTDRSPALCDAYKQRDSRVTVIHIDNSGIFQARKLGAEKATGEILTFSDADDWMEENTFETAMRLFCQYEPDILAYTYDCGEGKEEKHLYEEGIYKGEDIRNRIIPGMMYDSDYGRRRLNPSLCCKLIKKKLFTRVTKSVNDRIVLGEDALVTYPAVCLAESVFICNKVLYHYCVNESSCTHTYSLDKITEIKAFQDNMIHLFDEMDMLAQTRHQIENYVRSFLAVLVRNWYGIELSPVMFSFPYNLIPKGSKILVYGAGDVGKSYINDLKFTNYAEIAGWADKNYGCIERYNGIDVIAPEQVGQSDYDVLLIAVYDGELSKVIKEELVDGGIAAEKIIWTKPVRII